jgi:peptidoglycan/xylan/chitin deacetylase (PgdA/CDA1 family)
MTLRIALHLLIALALVVGAALVTGCRQGTGTQAAAQSVQAALPQAAATPPAPAEPPAKAHHRAPGTIAPADHVRVPILMYHHVRDLPPKADQLETDLTVSAKHFEEQLAHLEKLGCNTVTLAQVHAFFAEKRPLPAKPVCLTFDDGYLDSYTVAFPALQRHGMVGTFFITTGIVGDGQHVTWENLREMHAAGMEIGSHTVHHFELTGMSDWRLREELGDSKKKLDAEVGDAAFFCYPSGRKDAKVVAAVRKAGYAGAVTTEHGTVVHTGEGFLMPRLRVHGGWGGSGLAMSLASAAGSEYK